MELERAEQVPRLRVLRLAVARVPVQLQRAGLVRLERGHQPDRLLRQRVEGMRRLRLVARAEQVAG